MSVSHIKLGYPLDVLLNRNCKLKDIQNWEDKSYWSVRNIEKETQWGGLFIPKENDPGTGNIILRGRPGTGKSILALQMAVHCSLYNPNSFAVYISLEETPDQVQSKAESFSWGDCFRPLQCLGDISEFSTPENYGRFIERILTQPKDCPIRSGTMESTFSHRHDGRVPPQVLLTGLSPRSLSVSEEENKNVFATRYRQLENLLHGADWLRENKIDIPDLRLVCIDSLNVFGNTPLGREEIFRLFDLFKKHQTIGLFVMEEDESQVTSPDSRIQGDIIEYLSDVVISLQAEEDSDYFLRYFEIVKSRYQHQVYGKHPFKIFGKPDLLREQNTSSINKIVHKLPFLRHPEYGVRIYPSLHYIVSGTEPEAEQREAPETSRSFFGENTIDKRIMPRLENRRVILIEGPGNTFKQTFSINFLIQGLAEEGADKPGVLFIRLHDRLLFNEEKSKHYTLKEKVTLSRDLSKRLEDHQIRELIHLTGSEQKDVSNNKFNRKVWGIGKKNDPKGFFTEIVFKSGYVLPEEFIHEIRHILDSPGVFGTIRRVVFSDIGLIAVSYPFLKSSRTAGGIFLTTFIHTIRNYKDILLVTTGTTDQYKQADQVVGEMRTLADITLRCDRRDIFGDSYIVVETNSISEGGLPMNYYAERTPAVIMPFQEGAAPRFFVDADRLEGLVGFDTNQLHRPGLTFRAFEEGKLQTEYNNRISGILDYTFGQPAVPRRAAHANKETHTDIMIDRFDSSRSGVLHQSLNIRENKPLDRTVVSTVDEFCLSQRGPSTPASAEPGITLVQRAFADIREFEYKRRTFENKNGSSDDFQTYCAEFPKQYIDTITKEKIQHVQPYYGNVLLLAYRIRKDDGTPLRLPDGLDPKKSPLYPRAESWRQVKRLADTIYAELGESAESPLFKFDYLDIPATKSCLLMDVLVSSVLSKNAVFHDIPENLSREEVQKTDIKRGKMIKELLLKDPTWKSALSEPLQDVQGLLAEGRIAQRQAQGKSRQRNGDSMGRAGVYLCWYSQLRNLLNTNPDLTDKLAICALPGGGVRGEWYLGVEKGSVSIRLGMKIIDILCREEEEYARYVEGIGLPLLKKFYDKKKGYYAWPHGKHISLNSLGKIHRNAMTRITIPGYIQFHDVLHRISSQLLCRSELIRGGYNKPSEMKSILNRLPQQIRDLQI